MTQDQIIQKEVLQDLVANFKVAAAQSDYLNFLLRCLAKKAEELLENKEAGKFFEDQRYKNECADIQDLIDELLGNLTYFADYVKC